MNRALWIVQGLLALFFALGSGAPKLLLPPETLPMPIPLPYAFILFIGVAEVLETGNRSVERLTLATGDPHAFEIFGGVMVLFFVISFPLTRLSAYLERRLV